MLILARGHQLAIGLLLATAMLASRSYHFPILQTTLPSASWAVFFLAGVYLRPTWVLASFLAGAVVVDYLVTAGDPNNVCMSPAYAALILAYGVLWFAGRCYANRYYAPTAKTLLPLAASMFAGVVACEAISSGSFYVFSGQFSDPTATEFALRFARYFPGSLGSVLFWVTLAAILHFAVVTSRARTDSRTT